MKGLLVCATKPEWGELKKTFPLTKRDGGKVLVYEDAEGRWDLLQTGIGPERAAQSLQEYLKVGRPAWILHFGLSGGLDPALNVGDCLLASRITSTEGAHETDTRHHAALLALATQFKIPLQTICHFTSAQVLDTPFKKASAAQDHSAQAVDMESYAVCQIAGTQGIPYFLLRSVFDPAHEDLSVLAKANTLDAQGELKATGLVSSIVKSPKLLMNLPRYQKQASIANRNLATLIKPFIDLLCRTGP